MGDDGTITKWDKDADEEDLHMLYAIEPFLIWCQNDYGPDHYLYEAEDRMDITQIPRSAFLDYFYKFDIDNPTKEDKEQRLFQWARRHPASPQNGGSGPSASTQNGQSTTPSSSPKKKSDSMKKGAVSKTTNLSVRIINATEIL